MILFYTLLNVHAGGNAKPVPLTLAQVVDVVNIETVEGNIIFILPDDDNGSCVVIVNKYEVFAFTAVVVIATFPDNVLEDAVNVAVPCILINPLR